MIRDCQSLSKKLDDLRSGGLRVAIDDVGFASLHTVAGVKPDYLKIDMPLVRNIQADSDKEDIVRAIIFFAKRSHVLTIAEGIENEQELQKIIELGVDAGQGYFYQPGQNKRSICVVR